MMDEDSRQAFEGILGKLGKLPPTPYRNGRYDDELTSARWESWQFGVGWGRAHPAESAPEPAKERYDGKCSPRCWMSVDCVHCGKRKKPIGRDAPPETVPGLCTEFCPGYLKDPQPPHLWPTEPPDDWWGCDEGWEVERRRLEREYSKDAEDKAGVDDGEAEYPV